jgi:branched-chain amino acid aminotransferase
MPALLDSIAFCWNPSSQTFEETIAGSLTLSAFDLGTLFGAILVERIRTFGGKAVDFKRNLSRLEKGASVFGILEPVIWEKIRLAVPDLIAANQLVVERAEDVSVVIAMTPGAPQSNGPRLGPTCFLHIDSIPFSRLSQWYQKGTPLRSVTNTAVPNACWPTSIKTRSRLPYYLSDVSIQHVPDYPLALLSTLSGHVADTAVANVVLLKQDGRMVSPSREHVLQGCSLGTLSELLEELDQGIEYRDVEWHELKNAREVILVGTAGCVWNASSLDGVPIGIDRHTTIDETQSITKRLQSAWINRVGFDFVEQAIRLNAS